jgi:hypothetical protein
MHWEILIIPLIALGVWIIGTLFKSEDDKTKKAVGRRFPYPPQNGGGRGGVRTPPGRRGVTDLDRFLDEARRRREPEERRKAPPSPSRAPEARPPLRERPTRQQPPPRPDTPVIVPEEAVVLPVPRPIAPPPVAQPVASPPLAREAPPPPAPATRPSPIAQQVRSLLSKSQTAATAFVLREIFDRPLCKRRR